jgi:hypothetical protein
MLMGTDLLVSLTEVVDCMVGVLGIYVKAVEQGASPSNAPASADAAERVMLSAMSSIEKLLVDLESSIDSDVEQEGADVGAIVRAVHALGFSMHDGYGLDDDDGNLEN